MTHSFPTRRSYDLGTRRSFRRYCIGSSQALAVPAGSCPSHDAALDSIQPLELTPSRRPFLADMKKRNPQPTPVDFILTPTVAQSRRCPYRRLPADSASHHQDYSQCPDTASVDHPRILSLTAVPLPRSGYRP